MTTPYSDSS